jgi:hypothetical protein
MRTVRRAALLLIVLALVTAGCGSSDDAANTPTACLAPAATYVKALEAAPGPVRLSGSTPISDCLVEDQSAGELADVGTSLFKAASLLSAAAERHPGAEQALRLGYLVGAVEEGASETSGIHTDLVRRIQAATRILTRGGRSSVARAYARGYEAGRRDG